MPSVTSMLYRSITDVEKKMFVSKHVLTAADLLNLKSWKEKSTGLKVKTLPLYVEAFFEENNSPKITSISVL